ncbi:unnamed protein product [Pylaiella littoralis]
MAWGAPRGVDDLIAKLKGNTTASTMCILSTRKFGTSDAVAFSAALSDNTSLSELLASGHPLEVAGATALGEAMSRNSTLRSLCVGDNTFGDEGVLALVEGLQCNRGLLVLDLEFKSIASAEGLDTLLKAHPTLEDLRLGRNQLGATGIKTLSAGLMFTATLLRLDLSRNLINAAAAEALGYALFGDHPTGNNTDGDENGISVSAGAAGGTVKGPPPPPLEFLDVSRNPLGDEGGAALLTAIGTSPTLTGLVMAEAGLGARAATALAAALAPGPLRRPPTGVDAPLSTPGATAGARACAVASSEEVLSSRPPIIPTTIATTKNRRGLPMLKTLDVSNNDVGVGGTTEIAGALSGGGAPQLESLSIGYNNVGDEGAAALGRAAGLRLASLDLSGNALSGVGVGAVLSAPGLREAKLFHNACGDEGVPLVLKALVAGGTVETLDLGANGLTGAGFEALLPGLAACSSLQTLEVGANANDDRAEEAIRQSQRGNPALDIAFRRGGEAMEGSGAPPGAGVRGASAAGLGTAAVAAQQPSD